MGGGDRGRHRDADRPAQLLRGVDEPGGQASLVLGDPARAAIETGMNANAVPIPTKTNGPARLAQKVPCTGTRVAHSTPPPIMAMPAAITSLAEPRVTSAWDRPAKATEVSDAASQARPAFSAE